MFTTQSTSVNVDDSKTKALSGSDPKLLFYLRYPNAVLNAEQLSSTSTMFTLTVNDRPISQSLDRRLVFMYALKDIREGLITV